MVLNKLITQPLFILLAKAYASLVEIRNEKLVDMWKTPTTHMYIYRNTFNCLNSRNMETFVLYSLLPYFLNDLNITMLLSMNMVKFMFSKDATKIDKIFTVDLTSKRQIKGEDFVSLNGLLRRNELYMI